jgi:hypothetical protein
MLVFCRFHLFNRLSDSILWQDCRYPIKYLFYNDASYNRCRIKEEFRYAQFAPDDCHLESSTKIDGIFTNNQIKKETHFSNHTRSS